MLINQKHLKCYTFIIQTHLGTYSKPSTIQLIIVIVEPVLRKPISPHGGTRWWFPQSTMTENKLEKLKQVNHRT